MKSSERRLQNTSSGYTVETEEIQEEAGTAKEKLDWHCQKDMDTKWDEAKELATNRAEWCQRVVQCGPIWMRDELRY